ncbi:YceI family protein [Muricauda sp. CAU 1633]|uniref:YceI family protein n=1 Tax=Allomuricauda sp. CAU 1633 TaxID=2816036 RepID=UPI001A8E2E0E|nr:YceI family protein [Muricauda sp. CAU 1633]MBO0323682.1 YceI family protein [Muricauda sp. CAU 1633]
MLPLVPHSIKSFLAASIFLVAMGFSDPEREMKVAVASESEVVISGTTNINSFNCKYNLQQLELPIRMVYDERDDRILFQNAKLELANDCFDCGGKMINKDFRELLKTESHPQVELRLLYVEPPKPETKEIGVGMEIIIAGVTRQYKANLKCEDQKNICVNGTLELRLSDFGLEPPRKALGMIKVDNDIKVNVSLVIKEA